MDTFFPVPPEPEGGTTHTRTQGQSIAWPELTLHEGKEAVFVSSPDKAPGADEITFRVWKEIWPVVGPHLLQLYKASLETGYVPDTWKTVKIVVLRKPGKANYTGNSNCARCGTCSDIENPRFRLTPHHRNEARRNDRRSTCA
jgi:hypothetical protein